MSPTEACIDVVELCALFQCLGFHVKSLNMSDVNQSQEDGSRTVVINCQASGLHVVLESGSASCSCPPEASQHTSGVWQVSGVAGGKQLDKEFGCSILGSLPKAHRDRLSKELQEMMRCIKENNESDIESKERANKSTSLVEIKMTPERRHNILKAETPTRYRSLDTLTAIKQIDQPLPNPGLLQKKPIPNDNSAEDIRGDRKKMHKQSTYTLSSSGSMRRRNHTSSPIQQPRNMVVENLIAAEKTAEELRHKIAVVIKGMMEDDKDDSSVSSLALDVSKISIAKGTELSKAQFASSPNLSGLGTVHEDFAKSKLKRLESVSTSNLISRKPISNADGGATSKLRRISPNIFKRKESPGGKSEAKPSENKARILNSIFKPKLVPLKPRTEPSPNFGSSKKDLVILNRPYHDLHPKRNKSNIFVKKYNVFHIL